MVSLWYSWGMSKRYLIPAAESRVELLVKNSRFIGWAGPSSTLKAAKEFIEQIKTKEPKHSHAVYAFAIGHGAAVTHGMSDAGEPSGTAGRPTLAVVKGSNLGDVTVVIIRYFGGTKLGTGGLVKAYTQTAQLTLAELPLTEKVERKSVKISLTYAQYDTLKRLIETHNGQVDEETFTTDVTLQLTFIVDDLAPFESALAEATRGQTVTSPP